MKLNKIFMALAATAMVGCSSEDVSEFSASTGQAIEDARLIELTPDFVIAGVGVEGATTRTHWEKDATTGALANKFLPIYTATATFTGKLDADADLEEQTVGLCWLGQGAVGTDVYTNYQFYHFGWLNNDETEADIDACGTLYNGSLYNEITMTTGTASKEAIPGTDWVVAGLPTKSVKAGADNLNYNSGVYKTENKSIFGGDYIVYYPFDENFKEAGTIPAKAETNWANVPTDWKSPEIGKATFRYSAPVTIEGGYQAANFGLNNLSSIAQLRVSTVAGDGCVGDNIDQIVLYSASQKLLKKAYLAADKIVAGAKGVDLYADTEGTKTIVATLTTPIALSATPASSAYITVLPTTVADLKALVHNATDGTWAQVDMANTVFPAGSAKRYDIVVKDADFTSDYIAVDEASLTTALTSARADVTADANATPTITLIGDIELVTAGTYSIDNANDANITIKGDAIIVPEKVTLNLNTNMESEVRVLGTSCCSGAANGGIVDVKGGTISDVTLEPSEARVTAATYDALNPQIKYSAAAEVAAGKMVTVNAGNVYVNAPVEHKGDIVIAEGAKVTVDGTGTNTGDLQFMGSNVTNDGTIEVLKGGKYDMTDANGNATATDGQRMTNNGKFIHNVDAGVGTAVQSMKQNGEYRCRVDDQIKLDDAFLQWTACSVIEMVEPTTAAPRTYNLGTAGGITPSAYKHNGKYIDIEVNATSLTTFNNPAVAGNGDSQVINIGNLTVKSDLEVKYVAGTGKRTLNVNGNATSSANFAIYSSKKVNITENFNVTGATFAFVGKKANEEGLAVTKDITVSGATFSAGAGTDVDAINITCANFYLEKAATATFGNRTDGAAKNLVVSGTISNPAGCTFNILPANQVAGSVLAWVTCKKLEVGGTFSAARPRVE